MGFTTDFCEHKLLRGKCLGGGFWSVTRASREDTTFQGHGLVWVSKTPLGPNGANEVESTRDSGFLLTRGPGANHPLKGLVVIGNQEQGS